MPLPKDKDKAEDLLLRMEELKDHQGYRAVLEHLTTLRLNSQNELESETRLPQLHQLQGRSLALKTAIRAHDDIVAELKRSIGHGA